ncbi:hypothetical protein SCLCIDRAFT_29811 [Scleroderma citrinum Foug A]|uniref:Ribonuclease H1 N-terminal domain-containing protein n=1 Tax=Scleroderma citrinum Foug A TaxID=1036808 RepID=A0A0C2ZUI6_9AGAM|nr:hypothetical protein SCLCIDRAFT_29811 [Scleroderma citrinum Foug A]
MPQTPRFRPPTAGSQSNLSVLTTLLERLDSSPADSATLASILAAKSSNAGPAISLEATALVEPTSPVPCKSTIYKTPTFPSSLSASSGASPIVPSSPSSWDTFGLHSSFESSQPQLPLTLATSPTSPYIDELLDPTPPATGPTTPIAVTLITSPRSKPKDYVIYYTDPEYEEALTSCADKCFLHQYRSMYYNIPVRMNSKAQFYLVTKGTHIGIFHRWDQAASEVLGVSGAVFYHVSSLAVGLENIRAVIEVGRAGRI